MHYIRFLPFQLLGLRAKLLFVLLFAVSFWLGSDLRGNGCTVCCTRAKARTFGLQRAWQQSYSYCIRETHSWQLWALSFLFARCPNKLLSHRRSWSVFGKQFIRSRSHTTCHVTKYVRSFANKSPQRPNQKWHSTIVAGRHHVTCAMLWYFPQILFFRPSSFDPRA